MPYKMIVADDEQIIRESICEMIDWKSLDIEIAGCCKNGVEVLDSVIDEYPDIVMTDIVMPGLSGLELIRRMQMLDRNIQFIILSGYKEFDYAQEAMKLNIMHYLLKPINEAEIVAAIEEVKTKCRRVSLKKPVYRNKVGTDTVEKVKSYVSANLSDSELSLKWIAENVLYMNVDYLSRQFVGETGEKFSAFLNRARMDRAKELLRESDFGKIHLVAEMVGCGQNPQYFSQVFKKYTGVTPSQYLDSIGRKES
jgi:two-component system response regulator YesN